MAIWFSWFAAKRNNCSKRRMQVTQTMELKNARKREQLLDRYFVSGIQQS